MKISAQLGRAFDRLLDIFAWAGCALIMFQVISISLEVIIRYFFGKSFGWVTSVNEWSLVYLTFLGAAWLQREGGHTSDDSIIQFFPRSVRVFLKYVSLIIAVLTCGMLTWYGTIATWENYVGGNYDFFKLRGVPIFYVYIIIPIGSFLWLAQILRTAKSDLRLKDTPPINEPDL